MVVSLVRDAAQRSHDVTTVGAIERVNCQTPSGGNWDRLIP